MKVLLATDGSDSSLKAVKRALELAEKEGADITIMSVAYYSKEDFDEMPPNIQDRLEAQAERAVRSAKTLFDEKGIKVNTVIEAGLVPANNIIKKAKTEGFDYIIMGSSGLTGLDKVFMGSTASKVAANAPCSVSIIR